jgi:glycyl-tRNA synthetase (class II)
MVEGDDPGSRRHRRADSAIIQHPRTWEASGHLAGFTDPLVQCLGKCKRRFRLDHILEELEARGEAVTPSRRGRQCDLTERASST